MQRKQFLKYLAGLTGMISLGSFNRLTDSLNEEDEKMPVLFVGHGSPMNAIEDNHFTKRWSAVGKAVPTPKAVLCISAHWLTQGTFVTAMEKPRTIHDFGGFPQALFDVQYPAPGHPEMAKETVKLIKSTAVGLNHDWGLDHGTWSVVKHMFPEANIPVFQLSIDYGQSMQTHYNLAKELAELRKKGILIVGSGNMVHNLGMVAWDKLKEENYGYDWAIEMNEVFKKHILDKNHQALIDYQKLGSAALLSIPTPDHYIPLLYTLALQDENESISIFNDRLMAGSLSMCSLSIGKNMLIPQWPEPGASDSTATDSL